MKNILIYIPVIIVINTLFFLSACKRNVINPDGEGCRKIEEIIGMEYPQVVKPSANWGTGKLVVSIQTAEDEPWQLRAYEADLKSFTLLDEAPIPHTSAWSKGNWIAYHDWDDGGVYRVKPDGSLKMRISSSPFTPNLLWHPEGDTLMVTNTFNLWRIDIHGNLVGDTLQIANSEHDLARFIRPLFWLESGRLYGRGQGSSNIVYYSLSNQELVEVYNFTDELDPGSWPLDVSSLGGNELVFCSGEGVFLFDLSNQSVGKRLLKGCENQQPVRVSAYDTENFFMEVSLVDQDGIQRTRVFRKNINKNSEEELEIF